MKGKIILKYILLFTLILSMAVSVLSFSSCKYNRSYDEAEVLEAARELIKESQVLNSIYYGDGIETLYYGSQNGRYYQADPIHLGALGIETVRDLMTLTEKTFSREYCEILYSSVLSPVYVEDVYVSMARYYQKYYFDDPTEGEECIMVYRDYVPLFVCTMVFDYSTLTVLGSDGDIVNLTVEALVINKDGEGQTQTVEISLYEEAEGWRINSPTYSNFIGNQE